MLQVSQCPTVFPVLQYVVLCSQFPSMPLLQCSQVPVFPVSQCLGVPVFPAVSPVFSVPIVPGVPVFTVFPLSQRYSGPNVTVFTVLQRAPRLCVPQSYSVHTET